MTGWLLDTNVVSELRKPNCHEAVRGWADGQSAESLFLSTVTLAEIRFGIEQQRDAAFRSELTRWLDGVLRPWFGARVLDIDEDVVLEWRRMIARGKAVRHTFSQPDLFIAAVAAVHGLCVVTRNVGDFRLAGVPVLNPWTGESIPAARP